MTIVNTATGEITESLTESDAKRLTERIRLIAESVAENLDKLAALVDEARVGSAWMALGYRSWTAYVTGEFSGVLPRLEREPRQEFVRELSARGMSTRAIAPVVGASFKTVARDLGDAPVSDDTPETPRGEADRTPAMTPVRPDAASREATPRPSVTGLDGKTYAPPPVRPRLAPVPPPGPDEFTDQDRAEELARNLSRNMSLLYAVTNPERRAEYIATWRAGIRDLKPLGWDFITPKHMRELSAALTNFADEWEQAHV